MLQNHLKPLNSKGIPAPAGPNLSYSNHIQINHRWHHSPPPPPQGLNQFFTAAKKGVSCVAAWGGGGNRGNNRDRD